MKKKISSKRYSFKGWNIKKWILGSKRFIVGLLGFLLVKGAEVNPNFAATIAILGISADRLYALIEYYIKEK